MGLTLGSIVTLLFGVVTLIVVPTFVTTGSTSLIGSAFLTNPVSSGLENISPVSMSCCFVLRLSLTSSTLVFFVREENSSASGGVAACLASTGFSFTTPSAGNSILGTRLYKEP